MTIKVSKHFSLVKNKPHLNPAKAKSKIAISPLDSCQGKRQSNIQSTCFRHREKGGLPPLLQRLTGGSIGGQSGERRLKKRKGPER